MRTRLVSNTVRCSRSQPCSRHRQGPARRPFDRRREGRPAPVSAARLQCRRHRTGGLADRGNILTMSTVAQSRDLSDRKTIENFAAVVQSVEQMKLLTILTTADIRGVGPGVWNGWKAQLLRTLILRDRAGVNRGVFGSRSLPGAWRWRQGKNSARRSLNGRKQELNAYVARHYPAYWLKVELQRKIRHARFLRASEQAGHKLAVNVGFDEGRGVTELTILAMDHPVAAVDHRGRLCVRRAPTSWTRRSTRPPMGARSIPSRSRGNTTATKMRAGAPHG